MNHCVPDWGMGDDSMIFHDLASASHKKPTSFSCIPEDELVELMWQNGHVVMHCQANRKNTSSLNEIKQCQKPEPAFKCGGNLEISAGIVHGEESTSWLQFPDDSLEKEFYSDLFCALPTTESGSIDKLKDVSVDGVKFVKCDGTEENNIGTHSTAKLPNNQQFDENVMPPPKLPAISPFPQAASGNNGTLVNFSHFSKPTKAHPGSSGHMAGESSGSKIQGAVGHTSSMATKSSSICGSNQVQNPFDASWSNTVTVHSTKVAEEESQARFSSGTLHSDMLETAVTSSSGGSGCSYGRTALHSASMKSHKRKGRDADESECQSEEAEYESNGTDRITQRPVPARRSRAAEVHNLSERRRRDRINEKMRALQELIPHCNKTDKASMLDEAIEYLKQLQLQVQMMWMGGGMTPMLFPGMQHYMSRMGLGVGHVPMPSMQSPILFPRVPLVNAPVSSNPDINQASLRPSPGLTPVNFQNQLQNVHIPESYSRYLGFQHMQALPQAMNLYAYGSPLGEQSQAAEAPSNGGHYDGGAIPKNFPNSKTCEAHMRLE